MIDDTGASLLWFLWKNRILICSLILFLWRISGMVLMSKLIGIFTKFSILCANKHNLKYLTWVFLLFCQIKEFDGGSGSVLRIQPLRTNRDEAIYECRATNSVAEITATVQLNILEGETWVLSLCLSFNSLCGLTSRDGFHSYLLFGFHLIFTSYHLKHKLFYISMNLLGYFGLLYLFHLA